MTLTPEVFVSRYPQLYHVAESGSWPSIERRGLLSTTALLDLFQASGDKRIAIESRRRSTSITICHPEHGLAVVRDQKPLNEAKLRRALVNLEPAEWYAELNRRVFFWPTLKQVRSLLQARPYRDRVHTVITVDSALLLARHLEHTELSPINSGATLFNPAPRGRGTFVPLLAIPMNGGRSGDSPR